MGLASSLSQPASNFHPQGLGYDTATNELLFMQQSTQTLYRTDLTGSVTGSRTLGLNHTVSAAADGSNYYFSDYSGNAGGLDLYSIGKSSGSAQTISADVAAYGGIRVNF